MPGDIDYINLGRMIIPLELNYCQCMLELEEYYEVIDHTTELLEKHKDCVKGYYKRAKAHAAVWNEKEAQRDFNMVAHLDASLASLINRELRALSERMKEKYWEEKEAYWNMLEKKGKEEEGKHDKEETEEETEDKGKEDEHGESVTSESKEEDNEGAVKEEEGEKMEASRIEGKDWQQMLRLVMLLQNEGNFLINEKCFEEASLKFKEAIEYVDFLQNKQVDQQDEDWESLEKVRLPLTLNLSQCLLELNQHQQVIELNNKLLKRHKGNFKAVYQRAQAHAALCNEDEAQRDFEMIAKLDPKFKPFVRQELRKLGERIRTRHTFQNKNYWDTTQDKWGPGGSKTKGTAGKINVKFAQKATGEKAEANVRTEESKGEESEESVKPTPAETEAGGDAKTKKSPDVEAEQCNKELEVVRESGEGLDNENPESVVVHGHGQVAPDNQATDKDSDPAPTSTGEDNVASKESASDKGRKKVKCQSSAAPVPTEQAKGTKAAISDKTGNGSTQSE